MAYKKPIRNFAELKEVKITTLEEAKWAKLLPPLEEIGKKIEKALSDATVEFYDWNRSMGMDEKIIEKQWNKIWNTIIKGVEVALKKAESQL